MQMNARTCKDPSPFTPSPQRRRKIHTAGKPRKIAPPLTKRNPICYYYCCCRRCCCHRKRDGLGEITIMQLPTKGSVSCPAMHCPYMLCLALHGLSCMALPGLAFTCLTVRAVVRHLAVRKYRSAALALLCSVVYCCAVLYCSALRTVTLLLIPIKL